MRIILKRVLLLLMCVVMPSGLVWGQVSKYPERPIRLIVPFPPGGSVDVIVRLVGPKVAELIGQQVVIDNRSGDSGIVGTSAVARDQRTQNESSIIRLRNGVAQGA